MYKILLADITVLSPFVEYFREQGGDAETILEERKIPLDALDRNEGKITKMQFYSAVDAMASNAGSADFGYRVGKLFQPQNMGALGESVLQASTLWDALLTLKEYVHQWIEGAEVLLEEEGENVWLIDHGIDGLSAFRSHVGQASVFFLTNLVRVVAGPTWSPKFAKTEASYNQALQSYQEFSETEFSYNQKYNAIAIPRHLMSMPMPRSSGLNTMTIGSQPNTLHDQLKLLIRTHLLGGQLLHARDAAEISGISERSFLRQLAHQGVSYRHLLDRARYEIAIDLLKQGAGTTEIARLLHYSGPNNFIRAFKRITGLTPSQWL